MILVEYEKGDFYISKYPVTQKKFKKVMGYNTSYFKGKSKHVEQVNWYEAIEYCNKLSELKGYEKVYEIDKENKDLENNNKYVLFALCFWHKCQR